jgi:3-oxoacyl-[acyl-carrier protein] reductase
MELSPIILICLINFIYMNLSLKGKTAIVCGSTQGIGLAVAKELAQSGADCILLARNKNSLVETIKSLPVVRGQKHSYFVADFTDNSEVKKVIESIVKTTAIHILVNNTGGPAAGQISEVAESAFLQAYNQHLINNHILAQAVIPSMKKEKYGRIINIISTSVRIPIDNLGVSNTTRAAVASWAKTLSNEVGQFNITVNSVLPGLTKTQRLDSLIESNAARAGLDKVELSKNMEAAIPMKRFGEAAEIAAVVAFLASPAASYVNGVSIPVDGGKTGTI